jgi:hypothetical protein
VGSPLLDETSPILITCMTLYTAPDRKNDFNRTGRQSYEEGPSLLSLNTFKRSDELTRKESVRSLSRGFSPRTPAFLPHSRAIICVYPGWTVRG